MKFGIIGLGRFGKLWANALLPFGEVLVYDKNPALKLENPKIKTMDLQQLSQLDILFLIVPISEFENICQEVAQFLNPNTLVIDCCSVKVHPANTMKKFFSKEQAIMATHPLFGPDSVQKTGGLQGHKIVVCPIQVDEIRKKQINDIFLGMGLKILFSSPEEHDKQMANSQALVHFIGRGLMALELSPQELSTPDFQALLNINNMVVNDTWQLFLDMHRYNPYTKEIREKFIKQLSNLSDQIGEAENHVNH